VVAIEGRRVGGANAHRPTRRWQSGQWRRDVSRLVLGVFGDTDPSRSIWRTGVLSLMPGATDGARDTEGDDGITELARDSVRGSTELARERDGVSERSCSAAGGARVHPNRDVRIAVSEGCMSCAGGDDREPSVVGVRGG
jgi:hypothetical protein